MIKKEPKTEFIENTTNPVVPNIRTYPKIRQAMELRDWENLKEEAINQINQAYMIIELQDKLFALAEKKIKELTK